jgi:hypothetical protein
VDRRAGDAGVGDRRGLRRRRAVPAHPALRRYPGAPADGGPAGLAVPAGGDGTGTRSAHRTAPEERAEPGGRNDRPRCRLRLLERAHRNGIRSHRRARPGSADGVAGTPAAGAAVRGARRPDRRRRAGRPPADRRGPACRGVARLPAPLVGRGHLPVLHGQRTGRRGTRRGVRRPAHRPGVALPVAGPGRTAPTGARGRRGGRPPCRTRGRVPPWSGRAGRAARSRRS